jgi:GT2 family glycosyltransferase
MLRLFGMVSTASSRDYTPLALSSFFAHTALREGDRFLLIDNDASLDAATLRAAHPRLELIIHTRPHSFAENANLALAEARKTQAAFFFLNNDIVFTPGWLAPLETEFASISLPVCNTDLQLQGEGFVAKKLMSLKDYQGHEQALEKLVRLHASRGYGLQRVLAVPLFCVRIHPEVYEAVGDFDTNFGTGGGEDSDYCLRAAFKGYSVMLACSSWVLHFVGKSTWNGAENKEQTVTRNKAFLELFRKKWGEPLTRLLIQKELTPLQCHPELKPLYDEGSFRRLVSRLFPTSLPQGLLWSPAPGAYSLETPAGSSLDPQLLHEALEYAADRRHVALWSSAQGLPLLRRQNGAGSLGQPLPELLNPLLPQSPRNYFDQPGVLPLSLCMIVKNEAVNLGSCLRSVRGLVREVIVVDTGSSDGTQELARAYGARLIQTVWENDFSKARNLGLEAATGKWILVLDADELLLDADKAALRQLLDRHPEPDAGFTLDQNSSSDGGKTGILVSIVRLFPRRPDIRYEWPVHEQPVTSLERAGLPILKSSIRFLHTGYTDAERNAAKQRRNLAILRAQIRDSADPLPLTFFLMASSHLDLLEYEDALRAFEDCHKRCQQGSELALGSEVGAVICLTRLGRPAEALSRIPAELNDSSHPKLFSLRAECEAALGHLDEARRCYERLLACEARAVIPPCNLASEKNSALMWLGSYWRDRGNSALAVALLRKALESRQTGTDFRPEMLHAICAQHSVPS